MGKLFEEFMKSSNKKDENKEDKDYQKNFPGFLRINKLNILKELFNTFEGFRNKSQLNSNSEGKNKEENILENPYRSYDINKESNKLIQLKIYNTNADIKLDQNFIFNNSNESIKKINSPTNSKEIITENKIKKNSFKSMNSLSTNKFNERAILKNKD